MNIMSHDSGALVTSAMLRMGFAIAMGLHGVDKLAHFASYQSSFPDYLGMGSPTSLALVAFTECPLMILVLAGYFTRVAILPALVVMVVAATATHSHGWTAHRELAVLYAFVASVVFVRGDGPFSVGQLGRSPSP
jgi:putative oxidoreductase